MKKQPVQQEMMNNLNPPTEKQLDLDQTSAQNPNPVEPKPLIIVLQDAKVACSGEGFDNVVDLQIQIDNIKAIEDFISADMDEITDSECLDFILNKLGLSVN